MNKNTLRQCKEDVSRLESAADRIRELRDAYLNTKDDLEIAKRSLKIIATWATFLNQYSSQKEFIDIHDKAMDALARIS